MFGIGVLKGLEDAMLLFALWDFSCLYITLCGGYAWICYGVDKWIELDHKLQLKLLGKIY